MNKRVIGRVDKIDFPKLGLFHIDVKIDTGAYTSTIHYSEIIEENNTLRCVFNSDEHQNFGKTAEQWGSNPRPAGGTSSALTITPAPECQNTLFPLFKAIFFSN